MAKNVVVCTSSIPNELFEKLDRIASIYITQEVEEIDDILIDNFFASNFKLAFIGEELAEDYADLYGAKNFKSTEQDSIIKYFS